MNWRQAGAALLVVLGLAAGTVLPVAGQDRENEVPAKVASCGRTNGAIQVQMMLDVSISLEKPVDLKPYRLELARRWLTSLSRLAASGVEVELAIGTYGTTWTEVREWADFGPKDLSRTLSLVAQLPADEYDTDHPLGLLRANESLIAQTQSVESPCPLLLWFTDGEYDFDGLSPQFREDRGLDPRTAYSDLPVNNDNEPAIKSAGYQVACSDSGIIEQLRQRRVVIKAVALGNKDFSLVSEMATGEGFLVGVTPSECDLAPYEGGVIVVTNGSTTTSAPKSTTTTSQPGAPDSTSTTIPDPCSVTACEEAFDFTTPELADHAEIDVVLSGDLGDAAILKAAVVTDPAGSTVRLEEGGSAQVGGADVGIVAITNDSLLLQIDRSEASSIAGTWTVTIETRQDVESVLVSETYFSDIRPVIDSPEFLRGDSDNTIAVRLVRVDGSAVPDEALVDVTAEMDFPGSSDVPSVGLSRQDGGALTATAPATVIQGDIDSVAIRVTPNHPDVIMESAQVELPVLWPGYPIVEFPDARDGVVYIDTFDTPGSRSVDYRVTGGGEMSGCARAITTALVNPEGESPQLEYPAGRDLCPDGNASSTGSVLVAFDERTQTSLCGEIAFELTSMGNAEVRSTGQTVCLSAERGRTVLTTIIAALLAMIGFLTFGVLLLLNLLASRLPKVQVNDNRVSVTRAGVSRIGGGDLFQDREFQTVTDRSSRQLRLADGTVEIRGTAIGSPRTVSKRGRLAPMMILTGPRFWVLAPGCFIAVGTATKVLYIGTGDQPIRVPATLDGLWIVATANGDERRGVARSMLIKEIGGNIPTDDMVRSFYAGLGADQREEFLDG